MSSPSSQEGEIVFDDPENRCFGCSPHNPRGLQLRFRDLGGGEIEARVEAAPDLAGPPGVIHGGIQATLLDEVLGVAAHGSLEREEDDLVTADFRLRYRRPAPLQAPLRLRARIVRREGRSVFVEGEILDEAGTVLTRGEARWVREARA